MKRHVASVHEERKSFKCDICEYTCSQKSVMNRHVASVHTENKPFKCGVCDYKCSRKDQLNRHVKKHVAKRHERK